MATFFLLLGRTPSLSLLELNAVAGFPVSQMSDEVATVELPDDAGEEFFKKLGGSLKICKLIKQVSTNDVTFELITFFTERQVDNFSVAEVGEVEDGIDLINIKKSLKTNGLKTRFIESEGTGLSAAVLLHQKVTECVIVYQGETAFLTETIAVQDIDEWTERDRYKPYADRKKGMLPPKLARIMVNIGLGFLENKPETPVLYDPFCGTGTVLIEGATRGCEVIGSDLDNDAVVGARQNFAWAKGTYLFTTDANVFYSDATAATLEKTGKAVDLLVTEPFLGKPKPEPDQIDNIFRGLEKLYLGCFKQWRTLLKDGAVVVIVLPLTLVKEKPISLESLIDKLPGLGYTSLSEPVEYFRPQAVIHRQIRAFRFNK